MANSVAYQIAEAVQTRIRAKIATEVFTAVESASVVILKQSKNRERIEAVALPGILIELDGERHNDTGGTNASDDTDITVKVTYVVNDRGDLNSDGSDGTQKQTTGYDAKLAVREQLIDYFNRQRLTITDSRTEVYDCIYSPMQMMDSLAWRQRNLYRATLPFRFKTRRVRYAGN